MSWEDNAACQGEPAEVFFPPALDGHGRIPEHAVAPARRICRRCPARPQCLEHALEHEDWGVWAATTPSERRRMRLERSRP